MYEYRAQVLKVVDGDTVWLSVDLGFDVKRRDSFRLAGINAAEMGTTEGVRARDWLFGLLDGRADLIVTTLKDKKEKYGRYLCTLWLDGVNLNQAMVEQGYAVEYRP